MKVTKKINNNVAIGLDGNQHEIIIFGKGIGYPQMPYELTDLSKVDRTYYNIDSRYYGLLREIPDTIFLLVSQLLDTAKIKLGGNYNPNLVFVLADHINFSIERSRKGMILSLPYSYELEYEYPELTKISRWMVRRVNETMQVHLEKGEITSITMHFLNARVDETLESSKTQKIKEVSSNKMLRSQERITHTIVQVTKIVEDFFGITVDKKSFHYFRFKNHLKFFVQRKERGEEFIDTNEELFQSVRDAHPDIYECVKRMDDYFAEEFGDRCPKEEFLYLMIHVSQLYNKEDCNRKGITPEK